MALAGERLAAMEPLPLVPPGSVMVADGVSLLEDDNGTGTVFVWGQATWTWDGSDVAARRLAAVHLVNAKAASQRQVAAAFRANETTLWRWRRDYANEGLQGLIPSPMGPKGPSKLTSEKAAQIRELRSSGKSLAEVSRATGVSEKSVRRALGLTFRTSRDRNGPRLQRQIRELGSSCRSSLGCGEVRGLGGGQG